MRLLPEALALLVPPACAACRAPAVLGAILCPPCAAAMPWLRGEVCPRCALPLPAPSVDFVSLGPTSSTLGEEGSSRRHSCPAARAPWSRAWAPLAHAGPARELVLALKFRGAVGLADTMAAPLAARAPAGLLDGAALVPVPPHLGRARARGFDHAALLARALARRTGLSLRPCLGRGGGGEQVGVGRRVRLAEGRVEVTVRRPPPLVAVLVDDVHTTGATLAACARALVSAGTSDVRCVTYARTR